MADDIVGRVRAAGEESGRPSPSDVAATFEAFVRRALPVGRSFVRRRSPGIDPADVDDIVQTSLVKMYERWATLGITEADAAQAYFLSVLRTATADHFRALSRQQAKVERTALTYTEAEPDYRLAEVEFEMTVKDFLNADGLDVHLKAVILDLMGNDLDVPAMHAAGGWSKSISTSRQRRDDLQRARHELRPLLEQAGLAHPRSGRTSPKQVSDAPCTAGSDCPLCQGKPAHGEASERQRHFEMALRVEWSRRFRASATEREHEARQREWLEREISRLPDREQQVARLAATGATPAQIAARIGISANNARVTLCHARKKLQAKLNVTSERLDLLCKRPTLRRENDHQHCPTC
ncbi:sigma-70 family RNA polymerase sigma factor (plasmid) [Kitasatospora purpeofusca]|uniref:sigma-70 family RNA polymerase sigma factor n=1 Tax=Kitasatospora purpeofusca TaxID=67352 RepID=UPI002E153F6B|nr:sigma-70 family RNA polymerase sigma factor [Kitasatospora purpeofusca]WSR45856.1 sigma-70 family RNA polymerase sigma factor [Kitasatospora purpeofusca]